MKHVAIRNFKGFFAVVLMAMVDAQYGFRWVDVGTEGSCSDFYRQILLMKPYSKRGMRRPDIIANYRDRRVGENALAFSLPFLGF